MSLSASVVFKGREDRDHIFINSVIPYLAEESCFSLTYC